MFRKLLGLPSNDAANLLAVLSIFSAAAFIDSTPITIGLMLVVSMVALGSKVSVERLMVLAIGFPISVTWEITFSFNLAYFFAIAVFLQRAFWEPLKKIRPTKKTFVMAILILSFFIANGAGLLLNNPPESLSGYLGLPKLLASVFLATSISYVFSKADKPMRRLLLATWVQGASFTATVTVSAYLAQSILGGSPLDRLIFLQWRAMGFFPDPNLFAFFLLVSAGFLAAIIIERSSFWTAMHALPIFTALGLANSRAALFGFVGAATVLLFVLLLRHRRAVLPALAYVASGTAVVAIVNVISPHLQPSPETTSVKIGPISVESNLRSGVAGDARFSLWSEALRYFSENPVWGVGLGQIANQPPLTSESSSFIGTPHNTYITLLVEVGLLGFVIYATAAIALLAHLLRAQSIQSQALFATLFGAAIFCFAFDQIFSATLWGLVGVATGVAVGVVNSPSEPEINEEP